MHGTIRALVAGVAITAALAACDRTTVYRLHQAATPTSRTGAQLCDLQGDILDEVDAVGYTVDCTPDFAPYAAGDRDRPIWGWTDHQRRTVWLWPEHWNMTKRDVRVGLYHELHHVLGGRDETQAILYSWCRERPPGGFALLDATPTDARCAQVGA